MATTLRTTLTTVPQINTSQPQFQVVAPGSGASNLFVVNSNVAAVSDVDDPYEVLVGGVASFPAIRLFNSQGWPYLRLYLVTAFSGAPASPVYSTVGKVKAYSVQAFNTDSVKQLPDAFDSTNFDSVDHASVGGYHCLPLLDPRSFNHEQSFAATPLVTKDSTSGSGHIFTISEPVLLLAGPGQILVMPTQTPVATNEAKHMLVGQLSSY